EGRRMIQALIVDANTIRFCDEPLFQKLKSLHRIHDYVEAHHVQESGIELDHHHPELKYNPANYERLTNLSAFRQYIFNYVNDHPMINSDLGVIVSLRPQTEQGLPIQLLAFSREKTYSVFVDLQNEIFDHLMAVIPQFDLRLYQAPSSNDVQTLGTHFLFEPNRPAE
ncbi:MAG: hypothetical protein AAF633_27675, partial [Chloroflexota bacterium]